MNLLLLTIDQAAEVLGCGRTTAKALVRTGRLESVKLGRSRRVPAAALEAFVEELRRDQKARPPLSRSRVPA